MLTYLISKLFRLVYGLLYPAYASYLVVKNKDGKGYVHWMMYWIVFAFYSTCEVITDILLGPWFPLYYELKLGFLIWLVCPSTGGACFIYRRFVHPKLLLYEPNIELAMQNFQDQTTSLITDLGRRAYSTIRETAAITLLNGARVVDEYRQREMRRAISMTDSLNIMRETESMQRAIDYPDYTRSLGTTPTEPQVDLETILSLRREISTQLHLDIHKRSETEELLSDGEVPLDNRIRQVGPSRRPAGRKRVGVGIRQGNGARRKIAEVSLVEELSNENEEIVPVTKRRPGLRKKRTIDKF